MFQSSLGDKFLSVRRGWWFHISVKCCKSLCILGMKTYPTQNRALCKLVRDRPQDWDKHLDTVIFGLRTKKQMTMKFSPFFLMFGREAHYPCEIPEEYGINENMEKNVSVEEVTESALRKSEVLHEAELHPLDYRYILAIINACNHWTVTCKFEKSNEMYMTSENQPVPVTAWTAGEMKASSPPDSMENRQKDKPIKGKKGKAARTLLRRVCKAVKLPFFSCCNQDRVGRLTPQTDALDDPEARSDPGPSRITPTADADLVCLAGQVCKYPESLSCVLASCEIKRTPDSEPHITDSSSLNLCDIRPPKAEPGQDESQFVPQEESLLEQDQVSADLESVPVEEGPSEIEQEPDVVLPGSVSGSVSGSEQIVSEAASDTEPEPEIELPQVGHLIRSGNFSKVYEGTHIFSEKVKVAIKCIPKRRMDHYLDIAGHCKPVLAEVALMLRLGEAPSCPNIIQLHQWLEDESSFSLIMEYPEPCRTLEDFILFSDLVSERQARLFMLQAVQAVKHCYERGVYHGDIRSSNILVTLHTLQLKFIDFRCARLITSEGFKSSEYQGSDPYTPPEVIGQSVFHAEVADVWAMGILLFEIMHRYLPFESFDEILHGYINIDPTISTACHDLIYSCLSRNPAHRLTLEQLEEHRWMTA
ncbi:serine threonine- kinase pim-3-like protein [Labeo rohita]|uniref:non-specific serine/threonine protein kinase n=1 Tax=Labeo rohita TaxID=84645 RepID=A0A498P363_LABRO|nr:serine threonine- kinase pim-3-like protein [Labeo rohita]